MDVHDELRSASDTALMVAVARWNEDALGEVYRRHGAAVRNLALRIVASAHLADEVTQDVFLDLWRRPESFDPERGALRSLLLTKAHGKAVDVVRSESARRSREDRVAAEPAPAAYDIDHFAWDLATADAVRSAMHDLPERERDAIHLAYFEGMTYRQVASSLGEAEGTIKSRIRSGLKRMHDLLVREGVEVR